MAQPTDAIVRLNVGGKKYSTTRSTLCSVPNSMLARMFSGSVVPTKLLDDDGCFFIDRDGRLFNAVLKFLRTRDICYTTRNPPDIVLHELEYFGLLPPNGVEIPVRWESLWSRNIWHDVFTQSNLLATVFATPRAYMDCREQQLQPYAAPNETTIEDVDKVRTILEQRVWPQTHFDGIGRLVLTRLYCLSRTHQLYALQIAIPIKLHGIFSKLLMQDNYSKTLAAWLQRQFRLKQCDVGFCSKAMRSYAWPDWILDVDVMRHRKHIKTLAPPFCLAIRVNQPQIGRTLQTMMEPYFVMPCLSITFKTPTKK